MASTGGQAVDLNDLSAQQLSSVKKQLDEELEHLTTSFSKLRAAQVKFRDCEKAIQNGIFSGARGTWGENEWAKDLKDETDKSILVPLTTSLYVPGRLKESESVLVDVGTGFYVEKKPKEAEKFYDEKVSDLGHNLKDLETIVQNKSNSLRAVEEILRQKLVEQNSSTTSPQTAAP